MDRALTEPALKEWIRQIKERMLLSGIGGESIEIALYELVEKFRVSAIRELLSVMFVPLEILP